jgi:hypothetical protein
MFTKIYQAALNLQNLDELKNQIGEVHIDALEPPYNYVTPAEKLASEGHVRAVELLRQLGANVHLIARGFARAKNHSKVEEYRKIHQASVDQIAFGYAQADSEKVEEYIKEYDAAINAIAQGYTRVGNEKKAEEFLQQGKVKVDSLVLEFARARNYSKVKEYEERYHADKSIIAQGYALAGDDEKVNEYLSEGNVDRTQVVLGYALAGNHVKVEEWLSFYETQLNQYAIDFPQKIEQFEAQYKHLINIIAYAYALTGNHSKVEQYKIANKTDINTILLGYARAGNYSKVEEYRLKYYIDIDTIAHNYALAGNHNKVEEYRTQHQASIFAIAKAYQKSGKLIPAFYKSIIKLEGYGSIGKKIVETMVRLKNGQESFWNLYWMNSKSKLDSIMHAIEALDEEDNLISLINNPNSDLHKALKIQRITPITFLGNWGYNKSKTLIALQEEIAQSIQP